MKRLLALAILLLSFRAVSCFVPAKRATTPVAPRSPHHWPPPSVPPGWTTRIRSCATDAAAGEEGGLPSAGEGREGAPPPPPLLSAEDVGDLPSLWKRRLITREDPYSVHKISSILYSVSALVILGTGAYRHFFESQESFASVPPFLELPTYVFAVSNAVMCAVSTRMAFLHRRYDLTARNAFLGTGASSMFSGFYFLWTSPSGPGMFDDHLVSTLCFVVLVGLNVVLIGDTMLKVTGIVESRRDRKAADYPGRFWIDAMGYVLPVAWGLPPLLITFYVSAIVHDRAWFFEQCRYIDLTRARRAWAPS